MIGKSKETEISPNLSHKVVYIDYKDDRGSTRSMISSSLRPGRAGPGELLVPALPGGLSIAIADLTICSQLTPAAQNPAARRRRGSSGRAAGSAPPPRAS